MIRDAHISADGLHRFELIRAVHPYCICQKCRAVIQPRKGCVLWVLANPSTADAYEDDPTVRRAWGFTASWGYGEMRIVNVNPFRSTDPTQVKIPMPPTLMINEALIKLRAYQASLIVCAWGNNADVTLRRRAVEAIRQTAPPERITALELTIGGVPKHPLYLKGSLTPQVWSS